MMINNSKGKLKLTYSGFENESDFDLRIHVLFSDLINFQKYKKELKKRQSIMGAVAVL